MSVWGNVRRLSWFNFLSDFRPYVPIAILYFTQVSGSFALGMSVFSVIMLSGALFEVPTGVFSDRIGRRRTVIAGAFSSVLSIGCFALAARGGYGFLLIGAILEGLARSFFSGNNHALLYETLAQTGKSDDYAAYSGRANSMFEAALGLSALVGSLAALISLEVVVWISVIPRCIALIVSWGFVEPSVHSTEHRANVFEHLRTAAANLWTNPTLRFLTIGTALTHAVGESAYQFRAAFIQTLWPTWAIGIMYMLTNVTAAISFYFSGVLIRRFGEFRLLMVGISVSGVINIGSLVFAGILSPLIMSSNSIFFGVNTVAINSLMQREFSDQQRATMGSLSALTTSLVFAMFAPILGALADRIGVIGALVIAEAIAMSSLWVYRRSFTQKAPN
ncbi:MAG: MFS transporter [Anaerolineae bacterium]|jgi:MFS family permease|nr:MFS transporter [Anaerolineae bacterium]